RRVDVEELVVVGVEQEQAVARFLEQGPAQPVEVLGNHGRSGRSRERASCVEMWCAPNLPPRPGRRNGKARHFSAPPRPGGKEGPRVRGVTLAKALTLPRARGRAGEEKRTS